MRLREGDLLVLWGTPRTFAELADHRGFLMMVPFAARSIAAIAPSLALGIVAAVVAAAASGVVPAQLAFLAGAVAMVLRGCVAVESGVSRDRRAHLRDDRGRDPARRRDGEDGHGGAAGRASAGRDRRDGARSPCCWRCSGPRRCSRRFFRIRPRPCCSGPIALALAVALGLPPQPFVVCTALGAVVAFLTPIGHHGNLLILNPGQYTFGDFLRVGVPLTDPQQPGVRVARGVALVALGRKCLRGGRSATHRSAGLARGGDGAGYPLLALPGAPARTVHHLSACVRYGNLSTCK